MKKFKKYLNFANMKSGSDFKAAMASINADIPFAEDLSILSKPFKIGSKIVPNTLAVQPCEGFDGTPEGKPSELVFRRYKRYAEGGSGIVWYESMAVADDGRCNPLQMMLNENTVPHVKKLLEESNAAAAKKWGEEYRPYNVLQLTHSGRRSVDLEWNPTPLASVVNPYLDQHNSIDGRAGKITLASDEKIESIVQEFINCAVLAAEAGFDSVDIKLCHEYILRELLSSFTRSGKYGGSFENRTRATFEIIDGIREKLGDSIDICVRLNAYDCIPYPYGWGMVKEEGIMAPDLEEPIKLCKMFVERNVRLINLSTMMPRYQPYGAGCLAEFLPDAEIDPYRGSYSLLKATREIKQAVPGGIFVATGLTWYEQFGGNVAAGCISDGWFDVAGFGRQAMAYPDYAGDILVNGGMKRGKCCITCDKCYDLIQKGHTVTGCVARDSETYLPIYRKTVMHKD